LDAELAGSLKVTAEGQLGYSNWLCPFPNRVSKFNADKRGSIQAIETLITEGWTLKVSEDNGDRTR